jgi:hypothetical protein
MVSFADGSLWLQPWKQVLLVYRQSWPDLAALQGKARHKERTIYSVDDPPGAPVADNKKERVPAGAHSQ